MAKGNEKGSGKDRTMIVINRMLRALDDLDTPAQRKRALNYVNDAEAERERQAELPERIGSV